MKRIVLLLALLALALPILAATGVIAQDAAPQKPGEPAPSLGYDPVATAPFDNWERMRAPGPLDQVRIQRRVVIRVGPASAGERSQMMALLPRRPMRTQFAEVEHGECVESGRIIGVQPTTDNRLLLYTSGREVLAARLENGCSARAFYSGFTIERSDDGRLCAARDHLQSRAGARCQVADFTRLVAVSR